MDPATLPPSAAKRGDRARDAVPGLVLVWTGGAPCAQALALHDGALALGRSAAGKIDDGRISRQHARVARDDAGWTVTDLSSQNGTWADGEPVTGTAPVQRVIRVGDSLLIPCDDIAPLARGVQIIDGFVRGPAMQAALAQAGLAARGGTTLHIHGESGTGKEGVAAAFHRAGPRGERPLISVNCATIPPAIAERLLFGAKRGAYSGAEADAAGYVQEADGGTLFLDEVGELDLQVQAKLLRALESGEVLPVGATRTRIVDFALCSATNKDLRAMVAAGTLREDLYYRIGRPEVTLPPLRQRPEEIPALVGSVLGPRAHVSLVEQCVLRAWPGNVRELIAELRSAALAATDAEDRVAAHHLSASAGSVFGDAMPEAPRPGAPRKAPVLDDGWRQRIEDALRASAGNVTAAARTLGLHRTQLRRLIEKLGLAADE